ncbi:MAG TPA: 3D domain-containing protein, partial [Bacillales bacterium]
QPSRGERSSEESSGGSTSSNESSSNESSSSASTQSSDDSSAKQFYVSSTAYTANCGGCSGVTATGINLKTHPNAKVIAVDPSVIPLGTEVWVEGYGYAIAADTGGAIGGNKIDVFFSSKSEAYSWGTRTVLIKILD